jgi:riboflavin-specific deaminase-like protein
MISKIHVFTNLAISMDGKIATKNREHIDPSRRDFNLMDYHRQRADAVLFGAGTLRAFKSGVTIKNKKNKLLRKLKRKTLPNPINIIVCTKLNFDPSWPFFKDPSFSRILVIPKNTPELQKDLFRGSCQFLEIDTSDHYSLKLLDFLEKKGLKTLLIEGGGGVLFEWVKLNLIDEWNITISPKVIGGEAAPTMVEGEGFNVSEIKFYNLKKCVRAKNELFLQYVR